MIDLLEIKPDINVRETEFIRLLGYPYGHQLEGRAKELAEWARNWYGENGKPWIYAVYSDGLNYTDSNLYINGISFSSKRLLSQFLKAGADRCIITAVSAGKELEEKASQLWQEDKPDEYFFLEIYGSAVVEHLLVTAASVICSESEKNGRVVLPHYSPGYTGWNTADQKILFSLLQKEPGFCENELEVLETGMLKPKKSMLAVLGISKHTEKVKNALDLIPCRSCSMITCEYRRSPYKHHIQQTEDVARMKRGLNGNDRNTLDKNARYTVSIKALQKWADERLIIRFLDDSSIIAKFYYEGSTCSNLGHPLKFDHIIHLSSADEGYRIKELECSPSKNDDGYTYMCEYIREPEQLEKTIKKEKPMLGTPLNDIIKWERQFSPEGCYCKPESREHKWGLAFEVLHYALANKIYKNLNEWSVL